MKTITVSNDYHHELMPGSVIEVCDWSGNKTQFVVNQVLSRKYLSIGKVFMSRFPLCRWFYNKGFNVIQERICP